MDLTLNVYSDSPDSTVVAVGGEIDVYSAPKLREKLISLVESGSYHLIIDMEQVEFLDSTGLGVLVGGLKRVRAHDGWIDLVCTQGRILRIFRITGLSRVFSIYESVAEAVAAHADPPPAAEAAAPSTAAGQESPTGSSCLLRRDRSMLSDTRATTVVSQPPRFATSLVSVPVSRSQVSCTASSASVIEPSSR